MVCDTSITPAGQVFRRKDVFIMFELVRIRLLQICRLVRALGLLRTIVLLGAVCFAGVAIWYYAATHAMYVAIFVLALLFLIHIRRSDLGFIHAHLPMPRVRVAVEYIVILMPIVLLIALHSVAFATIMLVGAVVIAFVPSVVYHRKAKYTRLLSAIPAYHFELIAGIRRYFVAILCLCIAGLALSGLPYISIYATMGIAVCIIDFYSKLEHSSLICALRLGQSAFMRTKLLGAVLITLALMFPALCCYVLQHPAEWYIALYFLLNAILSVACVVVIKYGFKGFALLNAISMLSCFIPVILTPFVAVVFVGGYRKSLLNLKPLLDDFNT